MFSAAGRERAIKASLGQQTMAEAQNTADWRARLDKITTQPSHHQRKRFLRRAYPCPKRISQPKPIRAAMK